MTGSAPVAPLRPLTDGDALTEGRRARLAEWLERSPLDLVVCCGAENVHYATGYRSAPGSHRRSQRMAALVHDGGTLLVGPYAELPAAVASGVDPARYVAYGAFYFHSEARQPWAGDVERHPDLPAAFAAALRRAGAAARIGVDAADCSPAVRAVLSTDLPEAAVEDVSHELHLVRAVKLPGEVERLRWAARLAEDGIEAALAGLAPGVTERELAAAVSATMSAGDGRPKFVTVTAGERAALSDVFASDAAVRRGDLVRFDIGCVVDGYCSDVGRTAVLGEAAPDQIRRYAAIKAGEDRQLELCKPGMTAGELFDAAVESVRAAGLPGYRRNHCGHGIGMEGYEGFGVAPSSAHVLEPGNTLCVETPFYDLGWGGMMVEDTLLVTGTGAQRLTLSGRELREVPA